MLDFIEKLRGKPGHVRQRIAVGTAAGVTTLIAVGWLAVLASSHPFSSAQFYATAPGSTAVVATQAKTGFQDLLGAVGAAGGSQAAGVTVVTESSTTVNAAPATVIPF